MKKIIVPIDYSDASLNAADYAGGLAKASGAGVILFHAFHLPTPSVGMPFLFPDMDELNKEQNIKLNEIGEGLSIKYGIRTKSISRPTFVLDELKLIYKQFDADLVVMGMRGSSLENKLFGSITVSAIRQGDFPVLAIPPKAEFLNIKKILYAYEHSCLSVENKLTVLRKIAMIFNAKIQILHVEKFQLVPTVGVPYESKNVPEMESLFGEVQHEYKYLEDESVIQGIERGVKEFNPDLLAMVPHKLDFWDNLFNRGKTDKVAYHTRIPLLSLPNPPEK